MNDTPATSEQVTGAEPRGAFLRLALGAAIGDVVEVDCACHRTSQDAEAEAGMAVLATAEMQAVRKVLRESYGLTRRGTGGFAGWDIGGMREDGLPWSVIEWIATEVAP